MGCSPPTFELIRVGQVLTVKIIALCLQIECSDRSRGKDSRGEHGHINVDIFSCYIKM